MKFFLAPLSSVMSKDIPKLLTDPSYVWVTGVDPCLLLLAVGQSLSPGIIEHKWR